MLILKFSLLNVIKLNKKRDWYSFIMRIVFYSEIFKIYFEVLFVGKKKIYNVV